MNKYANYLAILMLAIMFALMFGSSINDSAIFDEVAHIGAGYTYLKYQDGRLNPEHPPLLKSLAALPLVFLNLEFDQGQQFWTIENVNDRQWLAGNHLLYEAGNDADQILFWSRLPMILLTFLFRLSYFFSARKICYNRCRSRIRIFSWNHFFSKVFGKVGFKISNLARYSTGVCPAS